MTESHVRHSHLKQKALVVRLGDDLHAIPVEAIEEVLPALPVERIPGCPEFVKGVIAVRGHLIPVLDAAERLGRKNHQPPAEPHIVCLRVDDRLIGVEFDEALDLVDMETEQMLSADQFGSHQGFFSGVIEHDEQIIRLLNPVQLLAEEETESLVQAVDTA